MDYGSGTARSGSLAAASASAAVSSNPLPSRNSPSAPSSQETSLQETSLQETSVQETSLQETASQEASLQETSLQETASQETSLHETSVHETASNAGPLPSAAGFTNAVSALFGFADPSNRADFVPLIWPTPHDIASPFGTERARRMTLPLTWSGVSDGLRARIWAAMPEITGVANDVPESSMYPFGRSLSAFCCASVEPVGIAPTMYRPGAQISGFKKPSGV